MDPTTPNTAPNEPVSAPTENTSDGEQLNLFSFEESDGSDLDFLPEVDGLKPEPIEEPKEIPKEPLKLSSSLDAARAKLEAKIASRNKKEETTDWAAKVAELEAKLNRDLTPAEINAAAKKYIEEGLTPEQEKELAREKELQELKDWKASQEKAKQESEQAKEHADEVAFIAQHVEEKAEEYPLLASTWTPEFIRDKVEELIDAGEAENLQGALVQMEATAAFLADRIRTNKRALKAMFKTPEDQKVLIELVEELGLVPAAKKRNIFSNDDGRPGPFTITNDMKNDAYPLKDDIDVLPDDDTIRRNMKKALAEMQRAGGKLSLG